jgi:hypothetical protein
MSPVAINAQPHSYAGWWFFLNGAGGGVSAWQIYSDARLKRNIETVRDDSLALISRLNWVRYESNGLLGIEPGQKAMGLLAQEVAPLMPDAITVTPGNEEMTDVLAMKYDVVFAHATRAVITLAEQIKRLEARIKQLEERTN